MTDSPAAPLAPATVEHLPEPAVRLDGVAKTFAGGVTALRDVSLTVRRGEITVLLGLSGSGKSTLLRHVDGLHRPTSGTVTTLGVDPARATPAALRSLRSRVGFVFQQFHLVGELSVLENVCHGALASLRGPRLGLVGYGAAVRRRALEQLDRVGLGDRGFQRAETLSGGQQQRVAIARALMQEPEVLLADEPVASLDPESSAQVMALIGRIAAEDRLTVLCSLHQVELALDWAQRLVGLRDGEIVLDRSTAGIGREEAMAVYARVGAATAPVALTG